MSEFYDELLSVKNDVSDDLLQRSMDFLRSKDKNTDVFGQMMRMYDILSVNQYDKIFGIDDKIGCEIRDLPCLKILNCAIKLLDKDDFLDLIFNLRSYITEDYASDVDMEFAETMYNTCCSAVETCSEIILDWLEDSIHPAYILTWLRDDLVDETMYWRVMGMLFDSEESRTLVWSYLSRVQYERNNKK
jgi:hypothetical protein